jgi:phosphotransferase system HPr (HPr) family protein
VSAPLVHESEFVVRSELGLHARPASQFVALAARFRAAIHVGRGEEWVDGRSILSLLSLAAGRGTALRIRAEGDDAVEAVAALGKLLEHPGNAGAAPEPRG